MQTIWNFFRENWIGSVSVIGIIIWCSLLIAEKVFEKVVIEPAMSWTPIATYFGKSVSHEATEIMAGVSHPARFAPPLPNFPSSDASARAGLSKKSKKNSVPRKGIEEFFAEQLSLEIQIASVPIPNQLPYSSAATPNGIVRKYCTERMFAFVEISDGGAILSYILISRAEDFRPIGKRSGIRVGEKTFANQEWQNEDPENQDFIDTGGRYIDYYVQGPVWRGTGYASTILGYTSAGYRFSRSGEGYLTVNGFDAEKFRSIEKPNAIGEGLSLADFKNSYLPDGHNLFDLGFQCR